MNSNIKLLRHKTNYDNYVDHILNQSDIFCVIPFHYIAYQNLEYIAKKLIAKDLFCFSMLFKENVWGIICLSEIDWENRNCKLKIGIFDNYVKKENSKIILDLLHMILDFCICDLRLTRIAGVIDNSSIFFDIVNNIFKREGSTISNAKAYYAYINR